MSLTRSESRQIAARYVEAFFELALEQKNAEKVDADLTALREVVAESSELQKLIHNPMASRAEKAAGFAGVLVKMNAHEQTIKFVEFLAHKQRLIVLVDVAELFHERVVAHNDELTAEVISAKALADKQVKDIKAALKKAVGKDVNIVTKEDASLIGGVIIKLGSRMLDHSVAGKLNRMSAHLKAQSLATS